MSSINQPFAWDVPHSAAIDATTDPPGQLLPRHVTHAADQGSVGTSASATAAGASDSGEN
jgi:hypothetical protein